MLVRNIAGLGGRVGLVAESPFSFGTNSGQIATPVNVQSEQGPTAGYTSAVQILMGSVAGRQPVNGTPSPVGVTVNQAAITPDPGQGSSLGNLLLAAGVVAGTVYLISPGKKRKAKVSGKGKSKYTVPLLIGGGLIALYFVGKNNAASAPVTAAPLSTVTDAAATVYSKTSQLVRQL
jgi:hypothetical protein